MYNFRIKNYGNGTAQLTYFHNPIRTKSDDIFYENNIDEGFYDEVNESKNLTELFNETYIDENEVDIEYLLSEEEIELNREHSIISSLNRTKKKIYDYGRNNIWEWFFTFTFERVEKFNAQNFEECKRKVCKWFENVRTRYCKNIQYLIVPEQHKSGAWHFHSLVSNCDELDFIVARNNKRFLEDKETGEYILDKYGARIPNKYYGKELRTSYPDGDYIYNIKQYKNGFTTATRVINTKKTVSYLMKYVTKEITDCCFGKHRYIVSKNLELPVESCAFIYSEDLMYLISDIEYKFGLKLSIDHIKTYSFEVGTYKNAISIFEFDVPEDGSVDDSERKAIILNDLKKEWYG